MSFVKNLIEKRSQTSGIAQMLDDASRRHNLKAAVRDLKLLHQLLQDGYRFDDDLADEHLSLFGTAVARLDQFVEACLAEREGTTSPKEDAPEQSQKEKPRG